MSIISGFKKYKNYKTDSNGDHQLQSFWTSSDSVDGNITEASTRANLVNGETLTTSLGKIKKFFSDLGTSAFKNTTDTYSGTGTDPVTGKAVKEAIDGLDVTGASNIAASKTIKAWSETDGKVSITTQDIAISNSQISGLGTASTKDVPSSGDASSTEVVMGDDSRLTDARPSSDVTDTYSSSGTVPVSGKAVASAIGDLDVTGDSNISAGKTIKSWSETDGKVSVTTQNISITKSQVSDFPTLGTAAAKDTTDTYSSTGTDPVTGKAVASAIGGLDVSAVGGSGKYLTTISETDGKISATAETADTTVTQNSSKLITSGAVWTAIDNLPEPLVFKGTLGAAADSPTITSLPTASSSNEGWTYLVITDGTYASQAAKIGDRFACATLDNGTTYQWIRFKAGDPDTDTWRNIKVNGTEKLGNGISTGGVDFVNGTNTTVAFDTTGNKVSVSVPAVSSSSAGVAPKGNSVSSQSQSTKFLREDGSWSAPSYTTNTDRYVNSASFADDSTSSANSPVKMTLTRAGSDTATVTGNLPKVSSSSAGVAPKGASVTTQSQSTKFLREDGTWAAPSYTTDTNTHRPIQMNGTQILGDNTTALNLKAGTNVSLSNSSGTVTITSTDTNTTYSLTQDGTDGHKITLTPSSGTAQTVTIPDNNTTYSFAQGTNNGEIKITPSSGSTTTVTPKGLSDLAYIAKGSGSSKYLREDGTWQTVSAGVTGVKGDSEESYRTGNVNITKSNIGLGNVGNYKAVSTVASQGLSSTEQANARANIGAGTSSLTIGTTSSTALAGDTKYAGSSSAGGAATSAAKLTNTSKVGDTSQPVYFTANGVPAAISYTISKSVPSDAKFTDTTYSDATTSASGLMSSSDKTKLNGIATGAEVNQNAFSNVVVGSTTIAADGKTDTLTLAAGTNITLTPDATNDKVTITATDTNTTYTVATGDNNGQIKVTPSSGSAYNVSVKGLGSNAYTSTSYLPLTGGTITGNIDFSMPSGISDTYCMRPMTAGKFYIGTSALPFGNIYVKKATIKGSSYYSAIQPSSSLTANGTLTLPAGTGNIPMATETTLANYPSSPNTDTIYFISDADTLGYPVQDNASATDLSNGYLPTGQTIKSYLNSNIQYGLIPQMTTGTTGTSAGYYTSPHVTITFAKPFNNTPAIAFQENGGNAERFYRYRIISFSNLQVTLCLIANAPSYTPVQGTYIAIGY